MPNKRSGHASRPAAPPNSDAIPIEEVLRSAGFDTPTAQKRARAALEAAGLTHARKTGIAAYKRDDALALLNRTLARVCGKACASLATPGRAPVVTTGATCEVCGGSNTRRAALAAVRALRANHVRNVLVVGGTAQQHREIEQLFVGSQVGLQFVDGTRASHSQKDAIANMARADLVIIWGSTPLRHAVSNLYTAEPPPHLRTIKISKRGIEALCTAISVSYASKRADLR